MKWRCSRDPGCLVSEPGPGSRYARPGHVLLSRVAACVDCIRPRPTADTVLLNGKIVQYGAAPAQALAMRDGRIAAVGTHRRHPRAGRAEHPRDRPRRPHRHSRPDQFPHPCHPRRAHLHHRGALDRRPHACRGARPYPRGGIERAERLLADRRRRLDRAAVRRRPPSRPRRRSPPPRRTIMSMCRFSIPRSCSRPAAPKRSASPRTRAGVAAHLRERRRRQADRLDQRRQPHHQRRLQPAAAPDLRAAGRRHPRVLPRAQRARHHRRARSRRLQHADRGIPAAVPGLARPRADRACRLQPVRAAPRP